MIHFDLPYIDYSSLNFVKCDNVSIEGRSDWFEDQNKDYLNWGYLPENTTYFQSFEVNRSIEKFCDSVFSKYSVSVIKQMPGNTIPTHVDTFYTFCKNNNYSPSEVVRLNVFLEDWKTGHYLELDENPVLHWTKGDAIIIKYNVLHLSGNMGKEPKYTMQITGPKNELTRCKASN